MDLAKLEQGDVGPAEFRQWTRRNQWTGPLPSPRSGVTKLRDLRAYAKMNLVVLPLELAFDFVMFCQRNPSAYTIADITDVGSPVPGLLASTADVRTDLPRYRVFRNGKLVDEPTGITSYWNDDSVAFLMGSSSCFDWALLAAGVEYETLGAYETSIRCVPTRFFGGNLVVTARRFASSRDAVRAIQISSRHTAFHGAPVHMGQPATIGIADLAKPDYPLGAPSEHMSGDTQQVLYWGCGILSSTVVGAAHIPQLITHYPACLMLTDRLTAEIASF